MAWGPVLLLLVLSPVCAEYLAAYDSTTGDAVALVAGLIVLAPLYGAPALLIREAARRYGLGWTGVLLLALAFGVLQAGLVDQSLFALEYHGIAVWHDMVRGTWLGPLGTSAYDVQNFVGGHVVYSIAAPIAVAEGLAARSGRDRTTWCGRIGLGVAALTWIAAALLVWADERSQQAQPVAPARLLGAAVVVVALVVTAVLLRRRARRAPVDAPAPRWWVVVLVSLALALVNQTLSTTWAGTLGATAALVVGAVLLHRCSRRTGWGPRQAVAVAAGVLLARGGFAFTYDPLTGDVGTGRKAGARRRGAGAGARRLRARGAASGRRAICVWDARVMPHELRALPLALPLLAAVAFAGALWWLHRRAALTPLRVAVGAVAAVYVAGIVANTVLPITFGSAVDPPPWTVFVNAVPLVNTEPADDLQNVLVFVPLGALLPLVSRTGSASRVLGLGFALSLSMELVRLLNAVTGHGGHVADVNDLLANTVGAPLGYALFRGALLVPVLRRPADRATWPAAPEPLRLSGTAAR
nr:VanZ family protein [Angustibacter aerolatus]